MVATGGVPSKRLAERVVRVHRALLLDELAVERLVVGTGRGALPGHVGQDAGADHGRPVARALAGRALADGRVAGVRVVGVQPVTEDAGAAVREKAVLALPARPIGGVERVEVDV